VENSAVIGAEPGIPGTPDLRPRAPGGLFLRVRTWLLRTWLDADIVRGVQRPGDRALALREAQLVEPRERTRLALRFERILSDGANRPVRTSALPIDRRAVDVAKPVLIEVILVLRSSEPVAPRGVVVGRRLLTDGGSAIYAPPGPASGDLDRLWHESLSLLFALRPLEARTEERRVGD
jgi:hypothetical protein